MASLRALLPDRCAGISLNVCSRKDEWLVWVVRTFRLPEHPQSRAPNSATRDSPRDLLAPVYNWFTEGFDNKDLKDAKALLESLR